MTRESLKEKIKKGQVFAPCIWDCVTARAAELETEYVYDC